MRRLFLQTVTIVLLGYSAWTLFLGFMPWYRFFPWELPASVSAGGCAGAYTFQNSYNNNPGVAGQMIPIVLAKHGSRGPAGAVADWSCGIMAREMRARTPVLAIVPSRYLCSSVRQHVVDLADQRLLSVGPPLWIVGGKAVGPAELHESVVGAGFAYTERGLVRVE